MIPIHLWSDLRNEASYKCKFGTIFVSAIKVALSFRKGGPLKRNGGLFSGIGFRSVGTIRWIAPHNPLSRAISSGVRATSYRNQNILSEESVICWRSFHSNVFRCVLFFLSSFCLIQQKLIYIFGYWIHRSSEWKAFIANSLHFAGCDWWFDNKKVIKLHMILIVCFPIIVSFFRFPSAVP